MEQSLTTCKSCHKEFTGKFCPYCGQKVHHEQDKSFAHLFHEAFHFVTHFEGTFFNTIKTIFTRPGQLSVDYCNGIRKKYFKPISFFLLLVIIYLLFPLFEGLNMKLYYHVRHDFYGEYAMQKTLAVMKAKNLTDPQIAELFHTKGEKTSKFLLFLIIPVMALVSKILAFKQRKYYFDHFIFSLEASSFFILWGFLLLPFLLSIIPPLQHVVNSETRSGIAIISVFIMYVSIASRRFFMLKRWYSIVNALLLAFMLILFLEFIYKFILFFISIHLV